MLAAGASSCSLLPFRTGAGVAADGASRGRPRGSGAPVLRPRRVWGARGGGGVSTHRPRAAPAGGVPAAERREELIAAAVHEFAHGGLHGTPVERIARRVGVAQPYVFSLFPTKRELFLAALERSFERVAETFRAAAADYREGRAPAECEDALRGDGAAPTRSCSPADRDYLMLQHQSYAACDDEVVRARVRRRYAELVDARAASSRAPTPSGWTSSSATAWRSTSPPRSGSRICRRLPLGRRPSWPRQRQRVAERESVRGGRIKRWPRRSRHRRAGKGAGGHGAAGARWLARARWSCWRCSITLFAVLNTDKVKVDWIFGSGEAPLIIVIVVSLLVGVILTHFAERRGSKRR